MAVSFMLIEIHAVLHGVYVGIAMAVLSPPPSSTLPTPSSGR